jgi:hypothetical protein
MVTFVWNDGADMTVLAVTTADLIRGSDYAGPHRGRGALRNRFPLERPLSSWRSSRLVEMLVGIARLLSGATMEGRGRVAVGVRWVGHLVLETRAVQILAAHPIPLSQLSSTRCEFLMLPP